MYKYRGRHTEIVFDEPLPARPIPPKPEPKNIVAEAIKAKDFLSEDHQRTHRHARRRKKSPGRWPGTYDVTRKMMNHNCTVANRPDRQSLIRFWLLH